MFSGGDEYMLVCWVLGANCVLFLLQLMLYAKQAYPRQT